jgi:hypothetical protein
MSPPTYAGSQEINSSQERVLLIQGEAMVCTAEFIVSHSKSTPSPFPELGRMRSLRSFFFGLRFIIWSDENDWISV